MAAGQLRQPVIAPALPALAALGLAHGLSDCAAGWMLGGLAQTQAAGQVIPMVLLYNGLAFGLQPLAGWLVDRWGRLGQAAAGSLLLTGFGWLLWDIQAFPGTTALAVLVAGLGSALLHAAGGGLALQATPGKSSGPGIFAAPGVLGLALGTGLAARGFSAGGVPVFWGLLGLLLLASLLVMATSARLKPMLSSERGTAWHGQDNDGFQNRCAPTAAQMTGNGSVAQNQPVGGTPGLAGIRLEDADLAVVLLVTAIALRSSVWNIFQLSSVGQPTVLLWLAVTAATGKIAGGLLADRLGWKAWGLATLPLAGLLLAASLTGIADGAAWPLELAGVFLLQSNTPVMLAWLGAHTSTGFSLLEKPATAAGLGLGLAILLGALPTLAAPGLWLVRPLPVLYGTGLSLLALWLAGRNWKVGAPEIK